MRKLFPGYYRPTKDEFENMWREAFFAFDANALLNLYRYSSPTRGQLLDLLKRLKDRIWLPHQVAQEYHEHRLAAISDQYKFCDELEKWLDEVAGGLQQKAEKHGQHSFVEIEKLSNLIKPALKKAKTNLKKAKAAHHDYLESDTVLESITDLFSGKVGAPYSRERLSAIRREAEERFKEDIPPGYKDKNKDGPRKYGDVVLWFQLIDHACEEKKPIIFVTDDGKEDWWREHKGKTVGPRPELIDEFRSKAGVAFYMYSPDQFLIRAEEYLELSLKPETVEEVREVFRESEEERQSEAAQRDALAQPSHSLAPDEWRMPITIAYGNHLSALDTASRKIQERIYGSIPHAQLDHLSKIFESKIFERWTPNVADSSEFLRRYVSELDRSAKRFAEALERSVKMEGILNPPDWAHTIDRIGEVEREGENYMRPSEELGDKTINKSLAKPSESNTSSEQQEPKADSGDRTGDSDTDSPDTEQTN